MDYDIFFLLYFLQMAAAVELFTRKYSIWLLALRSRPTLHVEKPKTVPKSIASPAAARPQYNNAACVTPDPATRPRLTARPTWWTTWPARGGRVLHCKTATSTSTWRWPSTWNRWVMAQYARCTCGPFLIENLSVTRVGVTRQGGVIKIPWRSR